MAVVDVHTHFLPKEFVDVLRSGAVPGVDVADREGRDPLIVHDNGLAYPVFEGFQDPLARFEQMDADGIDVAVVSVVPSLFLYWSEPEVTVRACRALNDAAAVFVERGGDRIEAMASVPMNDPEEAAEELRRSHRELGLKGVEIGTSVGEVQLDDPSIEPFWAAAEELGTTVMLHPYLSMVSPMGPAYSGFHLSNVVGNPLETFAASSRLIVAGVLDRHPGLKLLLVHGGGAMPYQLGRLEHAYDAREETKSIARKRPMEYLDNFLFDTTIFEPRALDFLLEFAGPERVLYGTDLPFDMGDGSGLSLRERVDAEVADQVFHRNAAKAFGIEVASVS